MLPFSYTSPRYRYRFGLIELIKGDYIGGGRFAAGAIPAGCRHEGLPLLPVESKGTGIDGRRSNPIVETDCNRRLPCAKAIPHQCTGESV